MDAALKTVAYLRVSTRSQDLASQKLAILKFNQKHLFPIDRWGKVMIALFGLFPEVDLLY